MDQAACSGRCSERHREDPTAAGAGQLRPPGETMFASKDETPILFSWLNLLGWQIAVERDGDQFVGVARHCTAEGEALRVGGCARRPDELAFQLFDAALKMVETRRLL